MEQQTNTTDWLAKEEATFNQSKPKDFEQLPSIKLVQDDIVEIDIDFSNAFNKWQDPEDAKKIKAIIPVVQDGQRKLWWLNIKNPVYADIIRAGKNGQTHFKILQTGTAKNTRYKLK